MIHEALHHLIDTLTAIDVLGGHHAVDTDTLLQALTAGGLGDVHDVGALLDALAHHSHGLAAALDQTFAHGHHVATGLTVEEPRFGSWEKWPSGYMYERAPDGRYTGNYGK